MVEKIVREKINVSTLIEKVATKKIHFTREKR